MLRFNSSIEDLTINTDLHGAKIISESLEGNVTLRHLTILGVPAVEHLERILLDMLDKNLTLITVNITYSGAFITDTQRRIMATVNQRLKVNQETLLALQHECRRDIDAALGVYVPGLVKLVLGYLWVEVSDGPEGLGDP